MGQLGYVALTQTCPQVISSTQFKLFLELEPQLREVLQCFYDSRYGHCLKLLEDMKDNLLLDLYLAPHIQTLFSMIRLKERYTYSIVILNYLTDHSIEFDTAKAQSFHSQIVKESNYI